MTYGVGGSLLIVYFKDLKNVIDTSLKKKTYGDDKLRRGTFSSFLSLKSLCLIEYKVFQKNFLNFFAIWSFLAKIFPPKWLIRGIFMREINCAHLKTLKTPPRP
jgi:hypothetical protein